MADSSRYIKTFTISWEQLHRDCRELAWRLLKKGTWKGIYAITRGGLVPAAILARELDIHNIDTVCLSTYTWKDQGDNTEIIKTVEGDGEGWLLIDDLVDTGGTAKIVREMLPKAYFATVYAKPQGRPMVDDCITEVSQDTWVLFPWDAGNQFIKPLADFSDNID